MNNLSKLRSLVSIFALSTSLTLQALEVPSSANIFGAGHSVPPAPSGLGGGTLPPGVYVEAGKAYTFEVFGTVSPNILYSPASPYAGADGGTSFAPTGVKSYGGISGVSADSTMCLVGVFLNDSEPADPAPPVLNFSVTNFGVGFKTLSPALNQTFFIGDGLTGMSNGVVQYFYAPTGATRLYLGFADGYSGGSLTGQPGFYSDNGGELLVNVAESNPNSDDATVALLTAQLTDASNQLAAVNLENQRLQNSLTSIANLLTIETFDLRSEFRDPSFVIPGQTPEEQLSRLVDALRGLNHGEKLALYNTLNTPQAKASSKIPRGRRLPAR